MGTIRDVAKRAGVSVATVSGVINGSRTVSDGLKARVEAAITELDYKPNLIARALYTKRTGTIGLLVPSLDNPFFAKLLRFAEERARYHGYTVLVGNTDGDPDRARCYGDRLLTLGVDGVLATLSWDTEASGIMDGYRRRRVPVVGVCGARATDTVDCFRGADAGGAAEAVGYLLALGHTEIAFLGARDSRSTELRFEGYIKAQVDAGMSRNDALHVFTDGYTEAHAYQGVLGLMTHGVRFTAMIAFNDVMAMGAQNALQDQGFKVPQDVSVIGFDNTLAEYTRPKLTTVSYPVMELGYRSVDALVSRMNGDDGPPVSEVLPTSLLIRESTMANRTR